LSSSPHYQFINQPAQLPPLLAALDRAPEIALDTEADNLFRYRTRVCLLQILADGEIYLVDLLADLPLGEVWRHLSSKPLIMHGSDYDLRLLRELCDFRPQQLFDTMFAAQLLSIPRFGLAALLEQHFGVKLDKDHQKANWSQRPLDRAMLDYAALDVFYLPALRDKLRDDLVRLGRLEWLEQKCQWQIEVAREGFAGPDENDWRIGGSEKLRGRGLAVLHALWHWREGWAEKLNTPPFKVTGNELLMRLSRAAEDGASPGELLQVNLGRRHDRLAPSLEAAIRQAFETDPRTLPRRERRREWPRPALASAPPPPPKAAKDSRPSVLPPTCGTRTGLARTGPETALASGTRRPRRAQRRRARRRRAPAR